MRSALSFWRTVVWGRLNNVRSAGFGGSDRGRWHPNRLADIRQGDVTFDAQLAHYACIDTPGAIRVRRVSDNSEVAKLTNSIASVSHPRFSPNGEFVTARVGKLVRVWRWKSQTLVLERPAEV
ncbi:MAG: hypothetical protein FJ403_00180 [Verrucomicrobia bacterium]|nr:hypothetical protein [Verrucomicrobiota bacterium]